VRKNYGSKNKTKKKQFDKEKPTCCQAGFVFYNTDLALMATHGLPATFIGLG
jgi:hypothetical protein